MKGQLILRETVPTGCRVNVRNFLGRILFGEEGVTKIRKVRIS